MKVKDYFKKYLSANDNVTFIIAEAQKDDNTPFYHPVYKDTPISKVGDCIKHGWYLELNVLNDHQMPIVWLSGADWTNWIEKGVTTSFLAISDEDMLLMFSEEQAQHTFDYIDKKIEERKHEIQNH